MKITSRITVKVDGDIVLNKPGFTFRAGGMQRETVTGDNGVHGFTETPMGARLAGNLSHTEAQDLLALGEIDNATILVETNTGQQYVMRSAWMTDLPELNTQGGETSVAFESKKAERI